MALVTVIEAADLTGKSRQTIYRHIKEGKLSKTASGKLDTAELLRVYGELSSGVTSKCNSQGIKILPHETDIAWFKLQVEKLQNDLKELKTESLERERRLMALLENQFGASPPISWVSKLFR